MGQKEIRKHDIKMRTIMATKYKVIVPPTMEQGSYTTIVSGGYHQTVPQAALQDYNSCRATANVTVTPETIDEQIFIGKR